jgi:hypothetical protein
LALQRLHDADLLGWVGAGIDADAADAGGELLVANLAQLAPCYHRVAIFDEPKATRDRPRRRRMVAGDHNGGDSGTPAERHGLAHLGSRRIEEADEPKKGHVAFDLFHASSGCSRCIGPAPIGERDDAQTLIRHTLGLCQNLHSVESLLFARRGEAPGAS